MTLDIIDILLFTSIIISASMFAWITKTQEFETRDKESEKPSRYDLFEIGCKIFSKLNNATFKRIERK